MSIISQVYCWAQYRLTTSKVSGKFIFEIDIIEISSCDWNCTDQFSFQIENLDKIFERKTSIWRFRDLPRDQTLEDKEFDKGEMSTTFSFTLLLDTFVDSKVLSVRLGDWAETLAALNIGETKTGVRVHQGGEARITP